LGLEIIRSRLVPELQHFVVEVAGGSAVNPMRIVEPPSNAAFHARYFIFVTPLSHFAGVRIVHL
jgi:hypothetical protein